MTSLTVLPDWRLEVSFFDGISGKVQMRELIFGSRSDGTFFEPLRDAAEFRKAEIVLGAVEWPNGANIDPDWMHDEIRRHGQWVVPAD
ncbi:MAG: DUF2442 domain-containing protein [SAR324 cluster bacterium]|nr:DUF2442 domain-containing protein [SAR324 cluster bacterium]